MHTLQTETLSSHFEPSVPDLLCFSHLRWNFVTQRPQHLLSRAAKTRRVFYWEEPVFDPSLTQDTLDVDQVLASLWVVRPRLVDGCDVASAQQALLRELQDRYSIQQCVTWYYTPMALAFSAAIPTVATVYDCMDELRNFLGAPPELVTREQELLRRADVVFTGGRSLYESKRTLHPNVHLFPSSIDAEHFAHAKAGALPDPVDQACIPHPRAGFCGVIDERMDTGLLREVAALRPGMQFVLVGPIVKIDPSLLPKAANIHYLGPKTYEQLPQYLAHWDVAMMPFALNEATRYISPTKTPEYLAAGKPVVSTPVHDVVVDYGNAALVAIAAAADEFAAKLDAALEPASREWKQAVAAKLACSSWDSTWAGMRVQINTVVAGKSSAKRGKTQMQTPLPPSTLAPQKSKPVRGLDRFDYLIVGAGFAGTVLAERLTAEAGKRVLLVDRRDHIAGNAYDYHDAAGVLVHRYGPHIFHTNSERVVRYLSDFTEWRPYEHRVLTCIDDQLLPMPINLTTINRFFGVNLDSAGMRSFLSEMTVQSTDIRTSKDLLLSRVGPVLYEKFYRNYTRKQWNLDPSELDASVAGRIPLRYDRDDRYFDDTFQAMPAAGYTKMFERMVDQKGLTVRTGVEYQEIAKTYRDAQVVFTGPIDEYYGFRFGALPYRSLEFKHETHPREWFQTAAVVNYPNDHEFTRVTEFKYLTGQKSRSTSVVYEYPRASGDPYYPIPRPENSQIYAKYKALADRDNNVTFCGRLANYRYFNMDQVVAQALLTFQRMWPAAQPEAALSTTEVETSRLAKNLAALPTQAGDSTNLL